MRAWGKGQIVCVTREPDREAKTSTPQNEEYMRLDSDREFSLAKVQRGDCDRIVQSPVQLETSKFQQLVSFGAMWNGILGLTSSAFPRCVSLSADSVHLGGRMSG